MVQRFGTPFRANRNSLPEESSNTAAMRSPLPDSSALEAGILEDERPSRLSRVQDNVRNLLRTSVFGSVKSSPTTPSHPPQRRCDVHPSPIARPEVLPSPLSSDGSAGSSTTHLSERVADFPEPPRSYQDRVQEMARQSAMFNNRAVAALRHPDLSDPSLESLELQKAQIRKRKAKKRSYRSRKMAQTAGSRGILCVLASLLLAALVATYISIATTEQDLSTTFHVLFILGICLATIVFAHSLIRLFFIEKRSQNRPLFVAVSAPGHRRRHHGQHHQCRRHPQLRRMPNFPDDRDPYVPATPIPVHLSSDDLREDPRVAHPTIDTERAGNEEWDKDVNAVPNPPPAYGRWRGSVRANPDLLHLQPVSSPVSPETPVLPSPTYEEAMAAARNETPAHPPSYATRESPARQGDVREARAGIAQPQAAEPEMVEVRGANVGLAL